MPSSTFNSRIHHGLPMNLVKRTCAQMFPGKDFKDDQETRLAKFKEYIDAVKMRDLINTKQYESLNKWADSYVYRYQK